jgi:DNA-binding response OmpR family regulator
LFIAAELASSVMSGSATIPQNSNHHILVVDDEPAIRNMVARILGAQYQVLAAASAHEALALAGKVDRISLLILDVMMPGMDGFELAKQLRALPSCTKTPIMFLTARDAPGDKIRGIQAGARNYITKPFSIDDLKARVKKAIGD